MPYCAVIRTERSFTEDSGHAVILVLMMCDFFHINKYIYIGAHDSLKVIKDARTVYFVSFIALSFPVTRVFDVISASRTFNVYSINTRKYLIQIIDYNLL